MIDLARQIINERPQLTVVSEERFKTIINNKDYVNSLDGDVIECGIYKGGMAIFLSKIFPNKRLLFADSFTGFEGNEKSKYKINYELLTMKETYHEGGGFDFPYEMVINNFNRYGIDTSKIIFLKGYVNKTLPKANIDKISLLRIDVDAYSATLEVLENLFDKVVEGGLIIFDDSCLNETVLAFEKFFKDRGLKPKLRDPHNDKVIDIDLVDNIPCGCYFYK